MNPVNIPMIPADLVADLREFLEAQKAKRKLYPYLHNNQDAFEPGKSSIYYSGPFWGEDEVVAALGSLLAGQWLSTGEAVRKFEIEFARRIGQKAALMVNSGSSANLVMFSALRRRFGWQPGDELIVSVVGFPTTVAPIIQNGLAPVFVDIEMDTLNFDLDAVEAAIGPRTRAIVASPALGNPPDMDRLVKICRERGILLVLDNCDSLGTKWKGEYLNQYAVVASHSLYSSHHLCTGEGGMVVSDDPELMRIARSMAWWGRDCTCVGKANLQSCGSCGNRFDRWLPDYPEIIDHRYVFSEIGFNLKPLDLQGTVGLVQLERFDEIHARRRESYRRIAEILSSRLDVRVPGELPGAETSWFGVPMVCPDKEFRRELVGHLEANRIQTRNYFGGNILLHPAYRHLGDWKAFPEASKVLDLVLFVGAAPHYGDEVFAFIDQAVSSFRSAGKSESVATGI